MQAILDNLTAILVGATLLGALVFVQTRQQQSAIETTLRDRAQERTSSAYEVMQRELENARARKQAVSGLGYYVAEARGTADRTDRLTFVTQEPGTGGGAGRMVAVSYRLVPTGETIRVGETLRPAYDIERWTNAVASGGTTAPAGFTRAGVVATDVVSFLVRPYDASGTLVTWSGTDAGYGRDGATGTNRDPVRYDIAIEGATRGPERKAGDQRAVSTSNLVRFQKSVRPVNAGARGDTPVTGSGATMRVVPMLPGEPAPPSPPPAPPSSPPSTIPSTPPSTGGGGTRNPAPAPPTRPAPPPGVAV